MTPGVPCGPRPSKRVKPRKALRRSTPVRKRSPKRSAVEKAHAAWSSFVRKRALGMCEYCGGLGSDAHHIYGRKAHPALRFAPINGIALCRRCHNEWHAAPISRRGWFAVMYPASWSMLQTFVRDGLKGA